MIRDRIVSFLGPIRARWMRAYKPQSRYMLFSVPKKSLSPISDKYGYDRGTPIDRYYIEYFMQSIQDLVGGVCLEITDNSYTKKFGAHRVHRSDVLDIDPKNPKANITADLRSMPNVPDNTYDTIIATHTFGVIDDYESALRECARILKPGGRLVTTVSSLGVAAEPDKAFWRFTDNSLRYLLEKYFDSSTLHLETHGNVLSGQAFWVGLSAEELTEKELLNKDRRFAVIVAAVAIKKAAN